MLANGKFEDAIKDGKSLAYFLKTLKEFDEDFCRNMFRGKEFTLKLEIRGAGCNLIHCRTFCDALDRPPTKKKKE